MRWLAEGHLGCHRNSGHRNLPCLDIEHRYCVESQVPGIVWGGCQGPVLYHRVEESQQLVHGGNQGDLFGCAPGDHARVEGPDDRIGPGGGERGHVQGLPHLRPSQLKGLALWRVGTILARSSCQTAVLGALLTLGLGWHATRQYLREWIHDGADRAAPYRMPRDVGACFTPLLRWVLAWWEGPELTLAINPTAKGETLVALVVSVVYRGLTIPVAWRLKPGGQPGAWMPDLCDRGLQSPRL